jgi:hypothetical protein
MCGAGYWYNSSIRGCSPCTTCSGGSSVTTACGVATDTVCGCPSNSSLQVDFGDNVRKCMCNIGYLWNTTSSSCAQCPSNTTTRGYSPMYSSGAACYCPVNSISNGTTCIACPSGSTATSSLVTLADTSQTCRCSTSDFTYNSVTNTCDCVTPGTYNNGGWCYYCTQCSSTTIARTFCSGSTNTSCESIPNTCGQFSAFTGTYLDVAQAGIYIPTNISGIRMTNLIYTGTIIRFVYSNVQYMMKVTANGQPVGSYSFFYGTYYTSYNTKLSSVPNISPPLTSFEFLTCPSITFVQ